MKTMKDYHNLYFKNIFKNYGLCSGHYLSVPALSWDAMLNMTKAELKLIPVSDEYFFFFWKKYERRGS